MSLLHLVHKSIIIKFTDSAKGQFDPEVSYAFRLTGVDAMGFLQIQALQPGLDDGHEAAAEPYWINKDLVREIHELDPAKVKETLPASGSIALPKAKTQAGRGRGEATPKPPKAKASDKQKSGLS